MLRSFKYRIYPTAEQQASLAQQFGCVRWIYNLGLDLKIKTYQEEKKSLSCFSLINQIPKLKEEFDWLKSCNAQSLQTSLVNLDNAFKRFFREKKGFPKFKKRSNRKSIKYPQHVYIDFESSQTKIPKLGLVKTIFDREFQGLIKTCTLTQVHSGKYFLSILVEDSKEIPVKPAIADATTLGIDLGLTTFATLSDGTKIPNPKHHKKLDKRIRCLQRRLSKKQKGSINRNKARIKVARKSEKVTNQRLDFLHKLSYELTHKNQVDSLVVENLNIAGMVKNHCLARAISGASWHTFETMLKYKCEWYGKNLIYIGRFDPSTKMCSACGTINQSMDLSTRTWQCSCGAEHDRDVNAAINIRNFGLQTQNLITLSPTDRGVEPVEMLSSCSSNGVN